MRISDWSSDVCSSDLVDDIGAEPLARDLERQQGARRIFEKGVDDGESGQGIVMLGGARAVQFDPYFRGVEDVADLPRGQLRDAGDRKRVVQGKSESVSVDCGGPLSMKKKNIRPNPPRPQ